MFGFVDVTNDSIEKAENEDSDESRNDNENEDDNDNDEIVIPVLKSCLKKTG